MVTRYHCIRSVTFENVGKCSVLSGRGFGKQKVPTRWRSSFRNSGRITKLVQIIGGPYCISFNCDKGGDG